MKKITKVRTAKMKNKTTNNKKVNLNTALVNIPLGLICCIIGFNTDFKISGMIFGGGLGISIGGIVYLIRYLYYKNPSRADKYEDFIKQINIENKDELIIKIRKDAVFETFKVHLIIVFISVIGFIAIKKYDVNIDGGMVGIYLFIITLIEFLYFDNIPKILIKKIQLNKSGLLQNEDFHFASSPFKINHFLYYQFLYYHLLSLCLFASNKSTPALTPRFRLSVFSLIGMVILLVTIASTSSLIPLASLPKIRQKPPDKSHS